MQPVRCGLHRCFTLKEERQKKTACFLSITPKEHRTVQFKNFNPVKTRVSIAPVQFR